MLFAIQNIQAFRQVLFAGNVKLFINKLLTISMLASIPGIHTKLVSAVDKDIAVGVGGLRFNSLVGQIGHGETNL